MAKKQIDVKKHPRKLESGKVTNVKKHTRNIEKVLISTTDKQKIKSEKSRALIINKREKLKELNETIKLLNNALKQLDDAEKIRKLNPAQRKRRDELKRKKKKILEEIDNINVKTRSIRKQKYKTKLKEIKQFDLEKQEEKEKKDLAIDINKKKIILSGYEKEFKEVSQRHQKIFQSISEKSKKEWKEHKYDYPEYNDWTYPEEIKIKKSLEVKGELYIEFRKAYDNYYLNKSQIENLEKKLVFLKTKEKKTSMFEKENEISETLSEIKQLRHLIKSYKLKSINPDYIKSKEDKLHKLELKYRKLTE